MPAPKYKDWLTLSAGSGYMHFFFSSQASSTLTAQSFSTPHRKHTQTHCHLLFYTSKCKALPGLSTVANMALTSFFLASAGGHQNLLWQLCFWYLYVHRIWITLCLSFHVSPLLACHCYLQLCRFTMWLPHIDCFILHQACPVLKVFLRALVQYVVFTWLTGRCVVYSTVDMRSLLFDIFCIFHLLALQLASKSKRLPLQMECRHCSEQNVWFLLWMCIAYIAAERDSPQQSV